MVDSVLGPIADGPHPQVAFADAVDLDLESHRDGSLGDADNGGVGRGDRDGLDESVRGFVDGDHLHLAPSIFDGVGTVERPSIHLRAGIINLGETDGVGEHDEVVILVLPVAVLPDVSGISEFDVGDVLIANADLAPVIRIERIEEPITGEQTDGADGHRQDCLDDSHFLLDLTR